MARTQRIRHRCHQHNEPTKCIAIHMFIFAHSLAADAFIPEKNITYTSYVRSTKKNVEAAHSHKYIKAKQRIAINIYLSAVSQFVRRRHFSRHRFVLYFLSLNWKWIRMTIYVCVLSGGEKSLDRSTKSECEGRADTRRWVRAEMEAGW